MSSALVEFNAEAESLEEESFEASGLRPEPEASVLNEAQEIELASGLLEINHPTGIGRYIDHLIQSVTQSCGKSIAPLAAYELSRLLQQAARIVLPALDPKRSSPSKTSNAAQFFGLELEGLSNEDWEFETVKAFVRLAESAARRLASEPHGRS